MAISEELKKIYASAPVDQRYIETLEVSHPAFSKVFYMTNDGEKAWQFKLENGSSKEFMRVPFQLQLPQQDGQGRQDMQVGIGNIGRELIDELDAAINASRAAIKIIYRVYLNIDNSSPQNDPPIELSIVSLDVTSEQAVATATRFDILNKRFPADVYRVDEFPGLKR